MPSEIIKNNSLENKVAAVDPIDQREPTIYDLAFIHIEVSWIRQYGLNELELVVFGFINSYKPSTGRIYFSNAQLGKMFNKSEQTISRCIGSLKEKGLVDVELQTGMYGGTIRYLIPRTLHNSDYSKMTRGVVKNEEGGSQKRLPNSNRNSNIKYTSKDVGINTSTQDGISEKEKKQEHGNKDINILQKALKEHYPLSLDGITDRRRLYNLIQVLKKRKNRDEWLNDDWKSNLNDFMKVYIPSTKQEYYCRSVYSLTEKIKMWREYNGKITF